MEKFLQISVETNADDPSGIQFAIDSQYNNETTSIPIPTPNFQSSFARSLSFNTNQTQSLDAFELNFRIGAEAADRNISGLSATDKTDDIPFTYSSLHNYQTTHPPTPTPTPTPPPTTPPPPLPSSSPPTFHNVSVELSTAGPIAHHHQDHQPSSAAVPAGTPSKPRGVRMYLPSSTPKRRYMTISSIKSHNVSFVFFFFRF